MVDIAHNKAVLDTILHRTAEVVGDIADPVLTLFYQRYPAARERFEHHGGHGIGNLERDMVNQALYCLMWWYDAPGEIEFLLEKSIPHHSDELKIPADMYRGFMTAMVDVIGDTIPPDHAEEQAVWKDLTDSLDGLIRGNSD